MKEDKDKKSQSVQLGVFMVIKRDNGEQIQVNMNRVVGVNKDDNSK